MVGVIITTKATKQTRNQDWSEIHLLGEKVPGKWIRILDPSEWMPLLKRLPLLTN